MPVACIKSSPKKLRVADTAIDTPNTGARGIRAKPAAGALVGGRTRGEHIEGDTSCRAAVQNSSLSTVVEHGASENGSTFLTEHASDLKHSSDYIGFGSLLESGTFFRERFVVRFSEVGNRGTVSLETLSSLLQEAATDHVIAMDYGFAPGKSLEGNITVITRMHIEVDRYPAWRDLVEIDTWFQREGKNAVRRDWTVRDVKTGENVAFATSTWVLMNTHTRRLAKLTEENWLELEPHLRHPARWALSEDRRNASTTKITKLGDNATFKKSGMIASEEDTDMNQHVNNIRYMSWMLQSVPEEVKDAYEISKITLEYRQEASRGEPVESVAETEEPGSGAALQFIHLIKTCEVGKEINRGRTVWRPVQ